MLMLLLNMRQIIAEVRYTRVAQPQRVVEEEMQFSPSAAQSQVAPSSPWDEDEK
jgi:hypothetical protein